MCLNQEIADQMNSSCFSLSYPWIVSFLIPMVTFAYGNFTMSIITTLVLVFSAYFFLIHSKHKLHVLEQKEQQPYKEDDHNDANQVKVVKKECLDVGSPESCSESEVIDQFSSTSEEDSDFDGWLYSGDIDRRPDCSDGSISDEESLIEIALPGGHYVDYKGYKDEEEPKFCRRQRSPESVLWWPEMNEEENMIEIDISVGSIKCSRFEIKA